MLATLQLLSYAYQRGMRAELGVENVLAPEARARRLRTGFLETPEQQVRFLADLPDAEQTRFLTDTLREIETEDAALDAMDDLWARGDVEALARVFDAQWRAGSPAVREILILQRNRAWADEIARPEGEGKIFIARRGAPCGRRQCCGATVRTRHRRRARNAALQRTLNSPQVDTA